MLDHKSSIVDIYELDGSVAIGTMIPLLTNYDWVENLMAFGDQPDSTFCFDSVNHKIRFQILIGQLQSRGLSQGG
jgi:hypothetical protein